mmetsp:Transcript_1899/g.5380  ORF Transcript_1899/g.5380 Transcript_1899/m.5380 type:complete len:334 (+) Transcript_1899:30-1031(+)
MEVQTSAVLDAMRKLADTSKGGRDPTLVRQLYALALLNREDAMRRLHSGLPPDVSLSQQPPSSLALARPTGTPSSSFRPGALNISHRTSGKRHRPGRRFGAMSSGVERSADAMQAISEARSRAIPAFPAGYGVPLVPGRILSQPPSRAQTADPQVSARGSNGRGPSPRASSASASNASVLARAPLRVADLETALPTKLGHNEPRPLLVLDASRSHPKLEPLPKSTVRDLLDMPTVRSATPRLPGYSHSGPSVASGGGGSLYGSALYPSSGGGGFSAPRTNFAATAPAKGSFDAWAAAEEDLEHRATQAARQEQMHEVKLAANVGSDGPAALGY